VPTIDLAQTVQQIANLTEALQPREETPEEKVSRLKREEAAHAAKLDSEKKELDAKLEHERLDRETKLKQDAEQAAHNRRLVWVAFCVAIVLAGVCFWILIEGPERAQTAAVSTLSAVVGALFGYAFKTNLPALGQSPPSPNEPKPSDKG
jgi:lipopolysaccharide export LptBFGC system permease protein LptF